MNLNRYVILPRVTIGLCVKNSEGSIKRVLDSILNQTYPANLYSIIVVDGESSDNTLSIIENVALNSNIQKHIFSDSGRGLGYARQIVVDNAPGDYIIWVDDDMIIEKKYIEKQVEFMDYHDLVGIAFGLYALFGENLPSILINLRKCAKQAALIGRKNIMPIDTNGAIYRVCAIREVNGFDRDISGAGEDKDLILRIKNRGWLFAINNKVKFYHLPRQSWVDLWNEEIWYGYGNHYIYHKHKNSLNLSRENLIISFIDGLFTAVRAYKLFYLRKSFILPILFVFQKISWWMGFIKGHINGYGHKYLLSSNRDEK